MISREEMLEKLRDSNNKAAYAYFIEIQTKSSEVNAYYEYFEDFLSLLLSANSYVRTRGFALCCDQAKWDRKGKIKQAFPMMIHLLSDEKPTVVRQCLAALHEVLLYRPELADDILEAVQNINLISYKDSMRPLIKKDMEELIKKID